MSLHIFKNGKKTVKNNEIENSSLSLNFTKSSSIETTPATYTVKNALKYINNNTDSQDNRRRLTALHVMSEKVITANNDCSIATAISIINDNECSHIVIINKQRIPLALYHLDTLMGENNSPTKLISELIAENLLIVTERSLVREIAALFIEKNITAISVVNNNSQLVGIITQNDLMGLLISSPHQQIIV